MLYVQEIAQLVDVAEDVASKNLQLLLSGGFLVSESISKYCYYRLAEPSELLRAVLSALREGNHSLEDLMSTLTALTHVRRVAIVSTLKSASPVSVSDLLFRVQVSKMAGYRHLDKLVRRGWVEIDHHRCRLLPVDNAVGRALIRDA